MNRREFVAVSSAVAATLSCPASSAGFANGVGTYDSVWVLFDRRFGPSQLFGRAVSRLTRNVHGLDGDVTPVWTEHLDSLWRRGNGTVAGMTTVASFICLQQLAAQHWFRVIARIEHIPSQQETVTHHISAEPGWQQRLRNSLEGQGWPRNLGPALLTTGRRGVRWKRAQFWGRLSRNWLDTPPLVSWYMAGRTEIERT
jgi:hypothetical protein